MSRLTAFVHVALRQHCDPIAFLEDQKSYHRKLWWPAWLLRGGVALAVGGVLGFVSVSSGQRWGMMVLCALLLPMLMQMLCSIPIMITHQSQFWLLYAYSPPVLLLALLWGLMPLASIWVTLGARVGLPYLVGVLVADVCTLWVYGRREKTRRERQRMRAGGPVSELPTLALWCRMRLVRMIAALGMGLVLFLFFRDAVAALAGVVGCLHLDVSLFAWLWRPSLVQFDRQQGQWRATFTARSALFVPSELIQRVLQSSLPTSDKGAALLALLQQGYLGPVVRRASKELSLEQAHRLILHLSLQEGGATVVRYLEPALPQSLHSTLACYAALATEAAKSLDLQRWVMVLTHHLSPDAQSAFPREAEALEILSDVRDALLAFTYTPALMSTAVDGLWRLVRSLYDL
jgi:hypothetical protein